MDINVSLNTAVISSDLDSIRLETSVKEKGDASFLNVCSGEYRLPFSKTRPHGNGGSRLCEADIEIDGMNINLVNEDQLLYILVSSCDVILQNSYETSIVQALSILFGKKLPILYIVRNKNEIKETLIKSPEYTSDGNLEHPINIYSPFKKNYFDSFLQSYCKIIYLW